MFGVYQCVIRCREALTKKFGDALPDAIIEEVLRCGRADIGEEYIKVITDAARTYVRDIRKHLREHHYDEATMHLDVLAVAPVFSRILASTATSVCRSSPISARLPGAMRSWRTRCWSPAGWWSREQDISYHAEFQSG